MIYGNSEFRFKYRFKQLEKEIDLGKFSSSKGFQYIIIKKDINDDSLLISIEKLKTYYFICLDIIKYEIDEIKPENEIMEIKGPKIIYYDFSSFDMYISYGIYSDQSYFYFTNTNKGTDKTEIVSIEYNNLSLIFHEKNGVSLNKKGFLFFNKENNNILEIKKFDFPIIHYESYYFFYGFNDYFQLCQRNKSKNELYFYLDYDYDTQVILPIIGSFDSYFINKNNIKSFSDLDFNEENKINVTNVKNGLLKIKCNNEPTMVKFMTCRSYDKKMIEPGNKYNIRLSKFEKLSINNEYINKTIPFQFNVFGLYSNESLELYFDDQNYYELNTSNIPFKINYLYKNETNKILVKFHGNQDKKKILEAEYRISVEIIVGFTSEDLKLYKQLDFIDTIGELRITNQKIIIKIPKNFEENLYDFSLIVPYDATPLDIQISYDEIEYAVPAYINYDYKLNQVIPLFNSNPFSALENSKFDSENKFIYITIDFRGLYDFSIYIKKPKIYNEEIQFNKFNYFPDLKDENKQYYYQIELSKIDYNYLLVQYSSEYNLMSISKNDYLFLSIQRLNFNIIKLYKNETLVLNLMVLLKI